MPRHSYIGYVYLGIYRMSKEKSDSTKRIWEHMQRVMNELFSKTATNATCVEDDVNIAVDEIIAVSSPIYEDLMYQLPEKQSRVLIAVAKNGCSENVTSGLFVKRHGLVSLNLVYLMSIYKKCPTGYAVPMGSRRDLSLQTIDIFLLTSKFFETFLPFLCPKSGFTSLVKGNFIFFFCIK